MLGGLFAAILFWILRHVLVIITHPNEPIDHVTKGFFKFNLPLNNGAMCPCNSIRLLLHVMIILSE